MEPTIRLARLEDAAAIARVHVRSWQHAYRGIMADQVLAGLSVAKWTDDWNERLTLVERPTFVLEVAGVIEGWVSVGQSGVAEHSGEVYGIYLAPESWSKSLGGRLLAWAERILRESGYLEISLWVVDANHRARRFYEKSGYLQAGLDREVVRSGMSLNQLRYTKVLPPLAG